MKKIIRIDGENFETLEEFFAHFAAMALNRKWGLSFDAFNDVLRGGFGTPEGGFVLEWFNHRVSKDRLGYPETIRQLELKLQRCHPSNVSAVRNDLDKARKFEGETVYDSLIEIIKTHCDGGSEEEDGVELKLL